MAGNRDRFHLVVSGDVRSLIQTRNSVSLSQLVAWNPAIGINVHGKLKTHQFHLGLPYVRGPMIQYGLKNHS